MMEGGGISAQLSTDFVSSIRPLNVSCQVTLYLIVSLQLRKCVEYVAVVFILVLNPQVDGLEVQVPLATIVIGELPINRDVGFLLLS